MMQQSPRRWLRRREGFTLIELIVVVAILGILAVVITPKVMGAMEDAKVNGAKQTAKQIQLGMERYTIDNNRYPSDATLKGASGVATTLEVGDVVELLKKYVTIDAANLDAITYTEPASATDNNFTLTLTLKSPAKTITITPTNVASN